MANLSEKLEQLAAKMTTKLPEEFRTTTDKVIKNLSCDESVKGMPVGEDAPRFTLPDATGNHVSLSNALDQGPVVLSFYRGSW